MRSNSKSVPGGGRDGSRSKAKEEGKVKEDKAGVAHLNLMIKLESDVKRLKCDLQLSRNRLGWLANGISCILPLTATFLDINQMSLQGERTA